MTDASGIIGANASDGAGAPGFDQTPSDIPKPRKRGIEAPPFTAQNQEAIDYLLAVLQAEAGSAIQSVEVSEAVALQIRDLVFSGTCGLAGGWACVYVLLALLVPSAGVF